MNWSHGRLICPGLQRARVRIKYLVRLLTQHYFYHITLLQKDTAADEIQWLGHLGKWGTKWNRVVKKDLSEEVALKSILGNYCWLQTFGLYPRNNRIFKICSHWGDWKDGLMVLKAVSQEVFHTLVSPKSGRLPKGVSLARSTLMSMVKFWCHLLTFL